MDSTWEATLSVLALSRSAPSKSVATDRVSSRAPVSSWNSEVFSANESTREERVESEVEAEPSVSMTVPKVSATAFFACR